MATQNLTLMYETFYATAQTTYTIPNVKAIVAVINNNNVAQTATATISDGAQQVAAIPALAASQIIVYPPPGLPVTAGQGLTVAIATAAPTGGGIQICYRTLLG